MYSLFVYGLGVHSTLPLPEFIPAEVECGHRWAHHLQLVALSLWLQKSNLTGQSQAAMKS